MATTPDRVTGVGHGPRPPSPAGAVAAPPPPNVDPGPLVGGRVARGDRGDDTGRGGVPADVRRSLWWRLALLGVAVAVVYGRELASLWAMLSVESPLAYAALAPVLVLVLAAMGVRDAPAGSAVLPLRDGDKVCGGVLLAMAVAVAWRGPTLFGFASAPWRVSLASLPFFLAGASWLLFGGRVTWWIRHGLVFAALAAPVWYVWAVTPLLSIATDLTWRAVEPLANLIGARTTDASGTGLVAIGDQVAAVSAVCSGASSMVAWLIVGGALLTRLHGPSRRRWAWLAAGVALAWLVNVIRILVVVAIGRHVSATVALGWVHPVAGLVAIVVVCVAMLGVARRFGVRPVRGEGAAVVDRLAAVVPDTWRGAGLVVAATAVVLAVFVGAGAWRFDQLGGRNGELNVAVASRLTTERSLTVDGELWSLQAFGEVPWASQYFGTGASWQRFAAFAPTAADEPAWTVAIDTTEVADLANLDAYTLEACYGFHGYQLQRAEVIDLLDRRPAERIDYLDEITRVRTVVVSWGQRVEGGRIERVVVSAQALMPTVTDPATTLPDLDAAESAVAGVARALAQVDP
jgi:exosortase/archaeosortase family protein